MSSEKFNVAYSMSTTANANTKYYALKRAPAECEWKSDAIQ